MENFIFCAVKDTIIKLIIENSKYNNENEYFQNKNNNDSTQNSKIRHTKKTCKTHNRHKDLNNFASLNRFKILHDKEIDDKKAQHNEHKDSISHSAGQPKIVIVSSSK